jgi:tRNA modification GTPase
MTEPPTIFALATASGRAGIAVIRISGSSAAQAVRSLSGAQPLPAPRHAALRDLLHPETGDILDRGIVLWFPGPNSFTGEDVAELQVHGGIAVAEALLAALARVPGLVPAGPGDFTRRAVLNGRLDLTQAEAVADLVEAETAEQRRQALRQMAGALGSLYEDWRLRLVTALAHAEAGIEFAEEEDLAIDLPDSQRQEIAAVAGEIASHLDDGGRGERLRRGALIVILGAPNAGKSSLLNRLARRDAAIVSATAGTTRDVIEVHMDLGGFPAILADTAGLREAGNEIEAEGVRRALARAADADLKLVVVDATAGDDETAIAVADGDTITVCNKIDLLDEPGLKGPDMLPISAKTGTGIEQLLAEIERRLKALLSGDGGPALTRLRHRQALEDCLAALTRAGAATGDEFLAEDIRLAVRALGRITGKVDIEDILDIVFADFCIGK